MLLSDSEFRIVAMSKPTELGARRRRMAMILTLIGLATFVNPLVSTDSEILGRTRWSPLQVVSAIRAGTLPVVSQLHQMSRGELGVNLSIDFLSGFGVVYLLLGLIAAAIVFFPSTRFIGGTSALTAAMLLGIVRSHYEDLQDVLYGAPSSFVSGHQVHAGILCSILLGVQLLLGFIVATKQID
jgi:hypothetical protein